MGFTRRKPQVKTDPVHDVHALLAATADPTAEASGARRGRRGLKGGYKNDLWLMVYDHGKYMANDSMKISRYS